MITHTCAIILGIYLFICIHVLYHANLCDVSDALAGERERRMKKDPKKKKKEQEKNIMEKKRGKKAKERSDTHAHTVISTKIWYFHTRDRRPHIGNNTQRKR